MSVQTADIVLHRQTNRYYGWDFAALLPSGVTLSGTPTVSISPTGELAASSVQVNSSTFTDPDATTITASKGVIAKLTGAVPGKKYKVEVYCAFSNGDADAVSTWVIGAN